MPLSDDTAGDLEIDRVCVLTSSSLTRPSYAAAGEPHTVFTGAMRDVLKEAMQRPGGPMPLADMFGEIRRKAKIADYPEPQQTNTGTAARLALVSGTGTALPKPPVAARPLTAACRRRPLLTSDVAVRLDDVAVYGPGSRPRIRAVTMSVRQGEVVAVIGPLGGGLSSVLQILLCLLPVDEGKVRLGTTGEDLTVAGAEPPSRSCRGPCTCIST
ncbi:MAG TPA: ATP-binding cassette domain-containing protein [Actinoplanes sp.]